jgi:CxxC motif-containing protein (DUF1111 family)
MRSIGPQRFALSSIAIATLALATALTAASDSTDPGPRGGPSGAGDPLPGLTSGQQAAFSDGRDDFNSSHSVDGSIPGSEATGLGPTFNLENCGGCHAFPNVGGSSPAVNPSFASAIAAGANNLVPSFLSLNGPVREVRFVRKADGTPDGGVHNLFTIAGRSDAPGCRLAQPDFEGELRRDNLEFRIPTPVFGDGLIENIPDSEILANKASGRMEKTAFGISGQENRNPQDGTITRFGWKAQNPSLMNFSGEAYNVEMGVTNEVFPNERSQSKGCQFTGTPEDHPDFEGGVSGVQHFTDFMRLVDGPKPAPQTAATKNGRQAFADVGCTLCHTPTMKTRSSDIAALSNKAVNLYSDLLVHNMGLGLADQISQGNASGSEFRTAPLWGVGQRLFFLHDGRTNDLKEAILLHRSPGSEANLVISAFENLSRQTQQNLLAFLRSL